jgi:hypothetical protein
MVIQPKFAQTIEKLLNGGDVNFPRIVEFFWKFSVGRAGLDPKLTRLLASLVGEVVVWAKIDNRPGL